jgi:hypothetical protein
MRALLWTGFEDAVSQYVGRWTVRAMENGKPLGKRFGGELREVVEVGGLSVRHGDSYYRILSPVMRYSEV